MGLKKTQTNMIRLSKKIFNRFLQVKEQLFKHELDEAIFISNEKVIDRLMELTLPLHNIKREEEK